MDALTSASTVQASAGNRNMDMSIHHAENAAPGRQFADILVIDDMENVAKKLRGMLPPHITQMSGPADAPHSGNLDALAIAFQQNRVAAIRVTDSTVLRDLIARRKLQVTGTSYADLLR
jgi:hypothetical protein